LRFWVRWNADLQTLRGSIAPFLINSSFEGAL
jgi:hypothetical protein